MRERSARHGARANILRISAACTGTGGRKYFGNREIMDLQESKQRMMGGTNLGNCRQNPSLKFVFSFPFFISSKVGSHPQYENVPQAFCAPLS